MEGLIWCLRPSSAGLSRQGETPYFTFSTSLQSACHYLLCPRLSSIPCLGHFCRSFCEPHHRLQDPAQHCTICLPIGRQALSLSREAFDTLNNTLCVCSGPYLNFRLSATSACPWGGREQMSALQDADYKSKGFAFITCPTESQFCRLY